MFPFVDLRLFVYFEDILFYSRTCNDPTLSCTNAVFEYKQIGVCVMLFGGQKTSFICMLEKL